MNAPQQTMGHAAADRIEVRGFDLTEQLIGHVDFASLAFLEIEGRLPSPAAAKMLDAILVTLAEHGMTATALVTRLTQLGAPGSLQGAVAAGLLGAGDVFLGAIEECSRLLAAIDDAEGDVDAEIERIVRAQRASGRRMPGLGHPDHKHGDPRTARLFAIADELGLPSVHRERMERLQGIVETVYGRAPLPINVDGACAALLSDLGLPWQVQRGIALVARCAGLVGHAWDELKHPVAGEVWRLAGDAVPYRAPAAAGVEGDGGRRA